MLRKFYNIYTAIFGVPELDEDDIKRATRYDKKHPTFTGKLVLRTPYSPKPLDQADQVVLNEQHVAIVVKFVLKDYALQCSFTDPIGLMIHFRGDRHELELAKKFCQQERFGHMVINSQPDPLNLADHYFWAE